MTTTTLTEPLRVIYHLTGSGGALATRISAAQPRVVAVDLQQIEGSTGIRGLVGETLRPIGEAARRRVFTAAIEALHGEMAAEGRCLVLRAPQSPDVKAGFETEVAMDLAERLHSRAVLLVRHPLDGFLSWWGDGTVQELEALSAAVGRYCAAVNAALQRHADLPIIHYESLVDDGPDTIRPLLEALDLPFAPGWQDFLILIPEDEGRGGQQPERLPRRAVPIGLPQILEKHEGYLDLCARLDYTTGAVSVTDLSMATTSLEQQIEIEAEYGHLNLSAYRILKSEVEIFKHELAIAQSRGQLESGSGSVSERAMSQLGQDLWVLEKAGHKREGYFVEFGATDGLMLSNSWLLEKEYGWTGICAEPNPNFFNKLQNNRSCTVVQECVGARTGEKVQFVFADVYGGMLSHAADDQHSEIRAAYRDQAGEVTLTTVSLEDLLIRNNAPRRIDYLSIDTEGSEFEILENFPFADWDIRLITVEHNFAPQRARIHALLAGHGYERTEAQWDDWYSRI